jgi:ATP-dependent RNA helicase RhlB
LISKLLQKLKNIIKGAFSTADEEMTVDKESQQSTEQNATVAPKAIFETQSKKRKRRKPRKATAARTKTPDKVAQNKTPDKVAQNKYKKTFPQNWTLPAIDKEASEGKYFQEYPLDKRILKAILDDLSFKHCTEIQQLALNPALAGEDLAARAQTGTGKTAVFLIAIIEAFLQNPVSTRRKNQAYALALAPTRELAIQIATDAEKLSAYTDLRVQAVYGGMDYEKQRQQLQDGTDLVVATPGRLLDFLRNKMVDLSKLKYLIVDEADRMLDMGFIPDVKRIINFTPAPTKRQTMLFSATLSAEIMRFAASWMRKNPSILETEPENIIADGISEIVYACTSREKLPITLWYLKNEEYERALIFRNRRTDVEYLCNLLRRFGIDCDMLSGDVEQKKRLRLLKDFKSGKIRVIVATDVAGRGIHIDNLTHVFNFDLPYEAEDYVHRIGRTARAGEKGKAISFAGEDCAFVIPEIEEYIGRELPIAIPDDEMLVMPKRGD